MAKRHVCVSCRALSPETETSYTLIERGWRLTSGQNDDGTAKFEWHCPQCWKAARSGTHPVARSHEAHREPSPAPPRRNRGR